jgi:putative ATPase
MRPQDLDGLLGQETIVGPGTLLRASIDRDEIGSIILWGPPGSGKTTLARIIANRTAARFLPFSAVLSGIKEIKDVMKEAEDYRRMFDQKTIVFIDEIHRFNRAQQDAFLPHVERGDIVLIGATTENPSFEVNSALLSRCKVFVLRPLGKKDIRGLLTRALADPMGLAGLGLQIGEDELDLIAETSQGDARAALNTLELVALNAPGRVVTAEVVIEAVRRGALYYDKAGEEHFNLISALRMLESGEDPLYIARRMVKFASEDVGNADPQALAIALAAKDAVHFLGMPEGCDALAQAAIYLSTSPKSNAVTVAYATAAEDIRSGKTGPVPLAIRNAPTPLMKELGYGKGYLYAHHQPDAVASMDCLPDDLRGVRYYQPTSYGFEATIQERMAFWEGVKAGRRKPPGQGEEDSK